MQIGIGPEGFLLIFMGALMFVLGLFQGLFIPAFRNSRMGLSAHLTAVQAGTAIVVFGVIWSFVNLSPPILTMTTYALIGGNYLIWGGITVAAITGASKALPIAGKGFYGTQRSEMLVTSLEIVGIALSLLSGALVVFGLGRTAMGNI